MSAVTDQAQKRAERHAPAEDPARSLTEETWRDVVAAMDRTYSELVEYQELLESRNRELDDMRAFMASVFASVSDLLLVVDRNRRIARTGGAIGAILQADADPAVGTALADLVLPADHAALFDTIDAVTRDGAPRHVEMRFLTPGDPAPLELSVSARRDARGRSQGVVLVGRPLGELRAAYRALEASHQALKQAQGQLVQNEKLASLGRLVAGVAHELNNPISFVYANTHALEKYTSRLETYFDAVQQGRSRPELVALRDDLHLERTIRNLRTAIDGAREGAERVRDIVEDLRRLSAEGTGETVPFDLETTARTAADWVVRGTKTPVRIGFAGQAACKAVGNPGQVQQIVMNLVQNAIDALADTEDPEIVLQFCEEAGSVGLKVIDNGPGIPDPVAAAIFDPFFTTKPVGEGTGLGLSISLKIAENHGGSLRLERTAPKGSCFALRLPAGSCAEDLA